MSGGHVVLQLKPSDAYKMLVCETHLGSEHVDHQSEPYVFTRREDGTQLIDIGKTWEKLMFAARAIAAVENPADVCVVSARPFTQRALLKFAAHTGATAIVGRFVPGSFTNQIQKRNFKEPRLIVVSDPRVDQQAIHEASYVNIPVIAFTNSDSPLKHVDIAIPGNNKGVESVGLMWWFLAREILRLRGLINVVEEKSFFELDGKKIMPDLYFYRDPEEEKKREELEEETKPEPPEPAVPAPPPEEWAAAAEMEVDRERPLLFQPVDIVDWAAASEDIEQPQPVVQQFVQPPAQFMNPPIAPIIVESQNFQAGGVVNPPPSNPPPAAANDADEW